MKNESRSDPGIELQKRIAMGDPHALDVGNYGVEPLSSHAAGNRPVSAEKHLADHERGARPPINRNQANPDHGPHGNHE